MRHIIGLSGGIGSGKSTIAALFAKKGAQIIDADKLAHEEIEINSVKERLKSRFGHVIINTDGSVNRSHLAKIVFRSKEDLAFLENCIHPGVREKIEAQVKNSQALFIVLDVPLLETSPIRNFCTHKVFIKVPDEQRWERVSSRGWDRDQWERREAQQMALKEKEKDADLVIENDKELENAEKQIDKWLHALDLPG